ncbi:hypothetical protein SCUCBS95973_005290 [Sporothrix curviconia]|uniref:Uncharacterized protein n=1 Tax=Sporothrix curviconia TaxID=1260050 RepID=A0ABP0BVT3_9PEZI
MTPVAHVDVALIYRMERRASGSGDDKNYRLHASSLATSPLSSAPVLQYSSSSASASQGGDKDRCHPVVAKNEPPNKTKAGAPQAPEPPSPRRLPNRPAMSLCATVTTLENELDGLLEDGGSESDQTWDDYLRSSPRVAPVS